MTEEVASVLGTLSGVSRALRRPFDPEEAAAEHHRLLGLEVFPYASVFLERDGGLGGAVSESAGRLFARADLPVPGHGVGGPEPPDHLGNELRLLSVLTGREDRAGVAELLGGHLLWWLPVFVHSAARHASPPWRAALELTLEAALDQARELGLPDEGTGAAAPPGALALPVEDPLSDMDAGLGRLARHLVTPARGGLFLSLSDLRALGRRADVPGGFGRRELILTNLLRSAAGYGEVDRVVEGLGALADAEAAFLDSVPPPYRVPWKERLEGRAHVLERLVRAGRKP